MRKNSSGTVLVYTLVLVVLGSIFATVSLNIAAELSARYDYNLLTSSLKTIIRDKGDVSMKIARENNSNGSGFIDVLGCPKNISMSGSSVAGTIDTSLVRGYDSIYCKSDTLYNGSDVFIYLANSGDDISIAEYRGEQIPLHSGQLYGQFTDSDRTILNLGSADYLQADGVDDNLDSDNYLWNSTGAIDYPQNYYDDDANSQLSMKGYIISAIGWYNVYWNNYRTLQYIDSSVSENSQFISPASTSSGALYLDVNSDHRIAYYRFDRDVFNLTKEMKVLEKSIGSTQSGSIGYLQTDMTLSPVINSDTLLLDFQNEDFGIFIENMSDGILLYSLEAYTPSSQQIFVTPLDLSKEVFSYLGTHIILDNEGNFITEIIELFGLK